MSVQLIPGDAPVQDLTFEPAYSTSQPYAVVVIDGYRFIVEEYEIEENAHGATNSGHVTFSVAGNPDYTVLLFRNDANTAPVYVQIHAGFPSKLAPQMLDISQLTQVFTGIADQYSATIDSQAGTVTFALRSLAAPLVDNKITAIALNMTSVQFLQAVCAQYGLTCHSNIIGQAITVQEVLGQMNVGGASFASALYGMHIWDLLLKCAEFDDVDVWEDARTGVIHYEAPGQISRNTVKYELGKNIESLSMVHSPQFNKNVQVEVRTYQQRTRVSYSCRTSTDPIGGVKIVTSQKTVTSTPVFGTPNLTTTSVSPTGTSTTTTSSSGGGFSSSTGSASETGKERYVFYKRNLSPAAANKFAAAKWRQISMHEYSVTIGDAVTPDNLHTVLMTSLVDLSGVQYAMFNDTYWPRRVTTKMNTHEGWKRTIEAVNHTLPAGAV